MKKALDLFCCAGGATKGLQQAGYHVTGVDIYKSPRYCGDAFIHADALEVNLDGYDLIWASPPCQHYSSITVVSSHSKEEHPNHPQTVTQHPDLIDLVRKRLIGSGTRYIIENVPNAPLINPIMLCGTMFGLLVVRHRLFETNPPIYFAPAACAHQRKVVQAGRRPDREKNYASVVGHMSDIEFAKEAMQIDWMNGKELAEAIPPVYSKWLAEELDRL